MGERLVRNEEAMGSSPTVSTHMKRTVHLHGPFFVTRNEEK